MAELDKIRKATSIYRISDPQPNLDQDDPSQPDYVKGRENLQEVRAVQVNGEEFLDTKPESGPLNLKAGANVYLEAEGNTVTITAIGGGGGGSGVDVVEGEGIDVTVNNLGQKVVSLEPGAITDEYIESISISKIVSDGQTIILHGGNANGEYN